MGATSLLPADLSTCLKNSSPTPLKRYHFSSQKLSFSLQMRTYQHIAAGIAICGASSSDHACSFAQDDLQALLQVLPSDLHDSLLNEVKRDELLEVRCVGFSVILSLWKHSKNFQSISSLGLAKVILLADYSICN
ncbi:uncharacterized protein LOC114731125 [Neltuma alba]|uniref:uncharacterized protein LOC114731125 n=1 Tax=Neltuma alba TaxID=207710 RepID=UPI0010A347B7|nr:uncharacterized protein LOC114731125 [Prosopis alba]